ncbi:MAG: shikimate dehydrogenase, partial [Halanaerobacter sp.]
MQHLSELNLAETKVTGLFGYPVEHSLSPAMHNDAFQELGLNHVYLP